MRQLTLVRHAKSSWKHPGLTDRERPLNKRGRRDAPAMGGRLATRGYRPDLIRSSPAVRAITTARVIAAALGYDPGRIVVDEGLYESGVSGLLAIVRSTADDVSRLMVFGHNPTMTEVINRLTGARLDNLPTCGMGQMDFAIDRWSDLAEGLATRTDIDFPKKVD